MNKMFGELSVEEKLELHRAMYEGKPVQCWAGDTVGWADKISKAFRDSFTYRIAPEPKVETVNQGYKTNSSGRFVTTSSLDHATHVVTFNLIDGEPDCTSIKMEKL